MVPSPSGAVVYFAEFVPSSTYRVQKWDVATNTSLGYITLPAGPVLWQPGMCTNKDGSLLYVTSRDSRFNGALSTVIVIDTATMTQVAAIPAGGAATAVHVNT